MWIYPAVGMQVGCLPPGHGQCKSRSLDWVGLAVAFGSFILNGAGDLQRHSAPR